MNKMLKKNRGGGFTLAELLIVIAIIAILVAIAMPIFSNALDEAREAVKNANIRSVKAAAVNEILRNYEKHGYVSGSSGTKDPAKSWTVQAEVDANSDITNLQVKPSATPLTGSEKNDCVEKTDEGAEGYTVTVYLKETDVTEGD